MSALAASNRTRRRLRPGFSLLEILLALAILGGSLAILSRIGDTGISAAREARQLSVARLTCQSKLSELLLDASSGISPQSVFAVPIDSADSGSNDAFVYSVDVQSAALDGLLAVRVTVESPGPNDGQATARYSLTRWLVDPILGLEAAEAEEKALEQAADPETPS